MQRMMGQSLTIVAWQEMTSTTVDDAVGNLKIGLK